VSPHPLGGPRTPPRPPLPSPPAPAPPIVRWWLGEERGGGGRAHCARPSRSRPGSRSPTVRSVVSTDVAGHIPGGGTGLPVPRGSLWAFSAAPGAERPGEAEGTCSRGVTSLPDAPRGPPGSLGRGGAGGDEDSQPRGCAGLTRGRRPGPACGIEEWSLNLGRQVGESPSEGEGKWSEGEKPLCEGRVGQRAHPS
jgi:hypothetical protein